MVLETQLHNNTAEPWEKEVLVTQNDHQYAMPDGDEGTKAEGKAAPRLNIKRGNLRDFKMKETAVANEETKTPLGAEGAQVRMEDLGDIVEKNSFGAQLTNLIRVGSVNINGNWAQADLRELIRRFQDNTQLDVLVLLDARVPLHQMKVAKNNFYCVFPKDTFHIKVFPTSSLVSPPSRASLVGGQIMIIRRDIPHLRFVLAGIDPSGCAALGEIQFEHKADKRRIRILSLYLPSEATGTVDTMGLHAKLASYLRSQSPTEYRTADPLPREWLFSRIRSVNKDAGDHQTSILMGDLNLDFFPQCRLMESELTQLQAWGYPSMLAEKMHREGLDTVTFPRSGSCIDHILTNAPAQSICSGGIGTNPGPQQGLRTTGRVGLVYRV